ncbi:S1C family serine protease [Halostella litorea]|uniref:S1C family serine protease n=1 Tax=Halostella litorea TaxID=2528831 RepID=UPI0010927685|nr:trypsin-like peptidase domain-containing protein [Halostella litorea]
MKRKAVWVGLAVVVLTLLVAVAVPALAQLPTEEDVYAQEGAGNSTQQSACQYQQLYENTSPAVVQVLSDGGQGSGFVFAQDNGTSYVVTNEHVVAGVGPSGEVDEGERETDTVDVRFADGAVRSGNVTGTDVYTDLAVVQVNDTPEGVESIPVAEESPPIGQRVAALGSPFGLEGTMTHGIVSGVNRSMPTGAGFSIPDTVQTDASINPGNSGGPLVSCDGEVVGVNRAGGGDNIGFAVSPALVGRVVPELIDNGSYDHPYLGVGTVPVTPAVAEANGLNASEGVLVVGTASDGPADGVLVGSNDTETVDGQQVPVGGDVIVAVDGQTVASQESLGSYLARETAPGEEVELTVIRDGNRTTVNVTLGERPRAGTVMGSVAQPADATADIAARPP